MPLSDAELYDKIRRTVTNKHELQVLESFLIFNKYVAPVLSSIQFDGVNPRVMLISLKAGALGLNLTVANNVYL